MSSPDPTLADDGGLALPRPPQPAREAARTGPGAGVAILLLLAAALPWVVCALLPPLNHDVAAVLNFSERWVAGERMYVDLIDVNPPLIFALNLLPAAIAWLLPVDAAATLAVLVLGLVGWSLWLSWRLLPLLDPGPLTRSVTMAGLLIACLGAGYDFAQREHLMLIASLPYLVLAAARGQGRRAVRRLWLPAAMLAACGFALKPHFLAVPALVELWVFCCLGPRRALRDLVPWTMAACWLLYLASLPLLFPAYFAHVVPLVWDHYVALGGLDGWTVLLGREFLPVALLMAVLVPVAFMSGSPLARVVALAAAGAFASAWVQKKGWSYHILPARLFFGLLAVLLACHWADRALTPARAQRSAWAGGAAAAVALSFLYLLVSEAPYRQIGWETSRAGAITRVLTEEAYGERILVLSPDVYPVYPSLNYARTQSTLRTMTLWLLQGVYAQCPTNGARYREPWEMTRTEFFVYRTVAEDFARAPPAVLLVSEWSAIQDCAGQGFDIIGYFSRHPLFAETFSNYRLARSFEGYRLYRREE